MSRHTSDVFISYASEDRRVARRVGTFLRRFRNAGGEPLEVYLDETHIRGGDLSTELSAAIASAATLVVVCSRSAVASAWVRREIDLFLQRENPRVALVIAADDPAGAIPPPLSTQEIRFHDLRRGAVAGVWTNAARTELLRLVAWITGAELTSLINWERRRLLKTSAAAIGALMMPTATAYWYADRNRPVEASDIGIEMQLSWIDEEGIGAGGTIADAMSDSPTLHLDVLPRSAAGNAHQWKWPTSAQRDTGMPTGAVRFIGRLETRSLESNRSTAGVWFQSNRRYRVDATSLGPLSDITEWDEAVAAATFSSLGLGVEPPPVDGIDADQYRQQLTEDAERFYGIKRAQWEDMDYSIVGARVSASLTLTVRNRIAGTAQARALRVWEHDEDARSLHALIFKPFSLAQ